MIRIPDRAFGRDRRAVVVLAAVGLALAVVPAVPAGAVSVDVSTEQELRDAFGAAATESITITADVTLTDCAKGVVARDSSTALTVIGNAHTVRQTCKPSGVFEQAGSGSLTFQDVTVTGGKLEPGGGFARGAGVNASGDVHLVGAVITENIVQLDDPHLPQDVVGGGVASSGAVTITNSVIRSNFAYSFSEHPGSRALGAGVAAEGDITVVGSTISENKLLGTVALGGGLYSETTISVTGSTVEGNVVDGGRGGGLYAPDAVITSSTLAGNAAVGPAASGGGGFAARATLTDSRLTDNRTDGDGGGFAADELEVSGSTVSGNNADGSGAGLRGLDDFDSSGSVSVSSSTIELNDALGDGGGVAASSVSITSSSVLSNYAFGDGGASSGGSTSYVNSTVAGNRASRSGGGISADSASLVYVTLTDNGAPTGANLAGPNRPIDKLELFGSIISAPVGALNCLAQGIADPFAPNAVDDPSCGVFPMPSPLLGPLAQNGGPTRTQLPLAASTAIGRVPAADCQYGPANGVTTDQRGLPRPSPGEACDAGAVQVQPVEGRVLPPGATPSADPSMLELSESGQREVDALRTEPAFTG